MTAPITVRIPATPHTLLRPNVTSVNKRERQKLGYPLNVMPAAKLKALLKADLRETAGWAARECAPAVPIDEPVHLTVTIRWEHGRNKQDFDAAIYGLKGVIDALMDAGWIEDDSQVTGVTVYQEKQKRGEHGCIDLRLDVVESRRAA